jgi:hypothetical protein
MGEGPAVDGHLLFAVKAPSSADLNIRIYQPGDQWEFYHCQVIPQK